MLVENPNQEFSAKRTFEFSDVNRDLMYWLEDIINENNCQIEKREWKSKYNNYVVYEYEPFCSDGFSIDILVSSISDNYINFVKYLYENKLNTIQYLERCVN